LIANLLSQRLVSSPDPHSRLNLSRHPAFSPRTRSSRTSMTAPAESTALPPRIVDTVTLSEEIVDKLKILGYEALFCKPRYVLTSSLMTQCWFAQVVRSTIYCIVLSTSPQFSYLRKSLFIFTSVQKPPTSRSVFLCSGQQAFGYVPLLCLTDVLAVPACRSAIRGMDRVR